MYQRISTRTEEDHKKRFLTERRKTKAAVKVAYNASCQARRKRHSFTSSSSPKQHTTHERNIENVHPSRALVLHERGYRPDDCICDEARAMGRSGGFYRVLDDWYVISSLFEYVVLRAKCVRSFVLGGIGSLSLSLVCFRSFSRVESLSFFLSLSLFKQHQVISRSRGRRVSRSNRLLPRSNKSSSRVISSFSTTPKTLPKLVYRILLLLTCDDTTYALGLQSFLYYIKCAFFVCAFHRFALILSFFSVLLLLFRLPVVSLASVGALLMMLMIRASSNARERTHDDFFCGRVDVHGFFSSFDFFLFFVVCGCFSSSASCS